MKQLSLPIATEPADCSEFLVSSCNKDSYKLLIEQCSQSISPSRTMLSGPKMSGKTRLAKLWCDDGLYINCAVEDLDFKGISGYSRVVIDNCHLSDEFELFHTINRCNDYGINLLLISTGEYGFKLADVVSRLNASLQLKILPPDNQFCLLVVQELSIMNKIKLTNTTLDYIKRRVHFDNFVNLWRFRVQLKHACDVNHMVLDIKVFKRVYDNWNWL
jgi:hypothetical protein